MGAKAGKEQDLNMPRRFISEIGTIFLALGMAFLVWIAAVREEDPIVTNDLEQFVPITFLLPADGLFVVGKDSLTSEIQVQIRAPESVWRSLTRDSIKATLDLSGYPAGIHEVPIKVEMLEQQASVVKILPSQLTVQLEPLVVKTIPISIQVMDTPSQGYFHRTPVSEPISATIKGAADTIKMVDKIVARINLNNSKETVSKEIVLTPRDIKDEAIKDIILEPASSLITVPIDQRFGYKDVSVKANVIGQPAPGYWISSITVEPATVTLVGGPAALNEVTGLVETAAIDLSGITEDLVKRVPLILPPGSSMVVGENQNTDTGPGVQVTIGIAALTGGRTMQLGLTIQGVKQDLTWTASPETVEVILSGSLPILQKLQEDDITLIIDLFGLPVGTHRIQPDIIYPDGIEITSIIPDTIEITLKPSLGTTATPVPARATPAVVVPTLTLTATQTITDIITSTTQITLTTPLTSSGQITKTD